VQDGLRLTAVPLLLSVVAPFALGAMFHWEETGIKVTLRRG
jgi:hypothetical protein